MCIRRPLSELMGTFVRGALLLLGVSFMLVSCKDVAVDPSTGKVIPRDIPFIPNEEKSGEPCGDCPPSRLRTSENVHEGGLIFNILNNAQPSTPEFDTTEFTIKVLPSTARSGPNTSEDLLGFEMSATIPETISKMNTGWSGYDVKTIRVNVPAMKLKDLAVAELVGDPEVKAGAMISIRPTGSGSPLKYLKTGDEDENKVSSGTVQVISIDRVRRVVTCRVEVMFLYRAGVTAQTLRTFDINMDLRFGY